MREQDANFVTQQNWSEHVEQNGKLITGQNPQSSVAIAQAVAKARQS